MSESAPFSGFSPQGRGALARPARGATEDRTT
jgi:hypothetical protein